MTLSIMTFSIMDLIVTLSKTILSIMTFSIMDLIVTLSIMDLIVTLSIKRHSVK